MAHSFYACLGPPIVVGVILTYQNLDPEYKTTAFFVISLEIKCPQLRKAEATAARTQNSIGDTNVEKNLGRNQAQSGGQFTTAQMKPAV